MPLSKIAYREKLYLEIENLLSKKWETKDGVQIGFADENKNLKRFGVKKSRLRILHLIKTTRFQMIDCERLIEYFYSGDIIRKIDVYELSND